VIGSAAAFPRGAHDMSLMESAIAAVISMAAAIRLS
jgi:hypothetical protein